VFFEGLLFSWICCVTILGILHGDSDKRCAVFDVDEAWDAFIANLKESSIMSCYVLIVGL